MGEKSVFTPNFTQYFRFTFALDKPWWCIYLH
jgi:hypothetical protein